MVVAVERAGHYDRDFRDCPRFASGLTGFSPSDSTFASGAPLGSANGAQSGGCR